MTVALSAACTGNNQSQKVLHTPTPVPPAAAAETGSLAFVAYPCVGMVSTTAYVPIAVTVRRGTTLVYRETVAAGREHTLVLPVGSYSVSAPNDRTVEFELTRGMVAKAHLTNGCK